MARCPSADWERHYDSMERQAEDEALVYLLIEALDALVRASCYTVMCDGWAIPPEDMVTCFRCRVIHDILTSGLVPIPDWAKDIEILDYKPQFAVHAYDSQAKLEADKGYRKSGFETYEAAKEWALDLLAEGAWIVYVESFRGSHWDTLTTFFQADLQRERGE